VLKGEKSYREAFDLIHRREAAQPNEVWQADHNLSDALTDPWGDNFPPRFGSSCDCNPGVYRPNSISGQNVTMVRSRGLG
jgi:hypothetical protein